jgi:glutathione S-transferase
MKLYSSPTSPFVRKVRVVIREKGAGDLVTEEVVVARQDPPALHAANPLGKIPALILDDGMTPFDSPLICEYLDTTLPGPVLLPAEGPDRWRVLRLQAAADGVSDAAGAIAYEFLRPENERSPGWVERWRNAIIRSLDFLEAETGASFNSLDLGHIAIGAALGYLDLRHGDLGWRNGRPNLEAVFDALSARPSFRETGAS